MFTALITAATTGCVLGPDQNGNAEWMAAANRSTARDQIAMQSREPTQVAKNISLPQGTLDSVDQSPVVRGQSPGYDPSYPANGSNPNLTPYGGSANNYGGGQGNGSFQLDLISPGSNGQPQRPMRASGSPVQNDGYPVAQTAYQPPIGNGAGPPPNNTYGPTAPQGYGSSAPQGYVPYNPPGYGPPGAPGYGPSGVPGYGLGAGENGVPPGGAIPYGGIGPNGLPPPPGAPGGPFGAPQLNTTPLTPDADVEVLLEETQTGRFQFGVGVNSSAGLTGQIVIDERNFDWQKVPTSWQDWVNGTAFRGAGQGLRIQLMPGTLMQNYSATFTEPYLFGYSPISLSLSAYYFNRQYNDWLETRIGGRASLGYRISHDLSVSSALRCENVNITFPRITGVPDLDKAVGSSILSTERLQLVHDTRDLPFFPTEGHYLEFGYEQAFGEFSYPRGDFDYRKYFLLKERPDGSGRHSLAYSFRGAITGAQTPIYENFFVGGYSTMRGFLFRGASPTENTVEIGGHMQLLGSVEYFFPVTADDMVKGVVFCDFGDDERQIQIDPNNYRVAPGFGIRLNIPALGPAPLAIDFAVPVHRAPTDQIQNISFFMGLQR